MKKEIIFIIMAIFLIMPTFSQKPPQDKNWEVLFQDNFNSFNTGLWYKSHNDIHGNPSKGQEESQIYHQNNAYIDNGKLILRTQQVSPYPCPTGNACQYGGFHQYTSGMILSNAAYQYGYYEIYAKLPASSGYWPAFWLWANSPDNTTIDCWYNEIDIFEAKGDKITAITSNVWYGFGCPLEETIDTVTNVHSHSWNYSTGYHWYGVEWNHKTITWYVDRIEVRKENNNFGTTGIQHPMQIIINVALEPINTNRSNQISSTTIFPNYMYIDQADGYRLKYDCNAVINEIPNFNTFNYSVKKSINLSGSSVIPANSNITLRATDFLELNANFTVPLGATFTYIPTECAP
ncbi:MAG: glycoside hydrolase family 16 protein [Bacteroidales bacterium]|jgi:beta-glucanase (GH16 family)|nr:glycoside hydrolase family 16 protein [Bacteroidales bacterium]